MGWTPIEEAEPPLDIPIIVAIRAYGHTYLTAVEVYMQSTYRKGPVREIRAVGFYGRDIECDFGYRHISHWQLMPSAPQHIQE